MDLNSWTLKKSTITYTSKPFTVLEKRYEKKDGSNFTANVLKTPNWANIIGLNEKNEILLIKQFRFGTDGVECEIPGGVLELGETPLEGAKREFEEETGYKSNDWVQIGVVDQNPAIQTGKCYSFLAKNIKPSGTLNWDPDEEIEYMFESREEVEKNIKNGIITNTYIIAAFYWLALHEK